MRFWKFQFATGQRFSLCVERCSSVRDVIQAITKQYPDILDGQVELVHRCRPLSEDARVRSVTLDDCDVIMVHCNFRVKSWQQKRNERARLLSETGKTV